MALVPYDSPVSQSGILFFNTLYDENAACHLALGRPYPENIEGGETMSKEELAAHGANDSMQHVDFMIGTRGTDIDGILRTSTASLKTEAWCRYSGTETGWTERQFKPTSLNRPLAYIDLWGSLSPSGDKLPQRSGSH